MISFLSVYYYANFEIKFWAVKICSSKDKVFYSPIVNCLGKPAQNRVPVGKVGLLLGDISLTVGEHVSQVFYKMVGLLFKDFLIKIAQVDQVTYWT